MALFDFLTLSPKSKIGDIEIAASIEETHIDALQLTEHPVELGAAITDHAYKKPSEVIIRCGWSNSGFDQLSDAVRAFFGNGEVARTAYIDGIYSRLLDLQDKRTPFDITTIRRQYTDMLLVALQVTTDQQTNNILMVQATCRQIIIVDTSATTLPARDSQANPADTSEIEDGGDKQLQPATPADAGAMPPK